MLKAKSFKPKKAANKTFTKKRLYDNVYWFHYSRKFLGINNRCYACGDVARVVDHVMAHKGDEKKFWEPTNLIPLCKYCHDFVTASFDRHAVPMTEEKMKWLSVRRLQTETFVKVKIVKVEHKPPQESDGT